MDKAHQGVGAISNAHVGSDFEDKAQTWFAKQGIQLSRGFILEIGLSQEKKYQFDLGSLEHQLIVECKSQTWTAGGKVPRAKMTGWNEAMYYFYMVPATFRKVFFVLRHKREGKGESLLVDYRRTYAHMIPPGVEFMEWNQASESVMLEMI